MRSASYFFISFTSSYFHVKSLFEAICFRFPMNAAARPDLASHTVSVSASLGHAIAYLFDLLTLPVPICGMSKS
jgi:hypothetical protein